jgi:TolB protein
MRSKKFSITVSAVVLFSLFFLPFLLRAEEANEYIQIRKQGASRISVALDRTSASGGRESEWAKTLDTTIHNGIEFTGLFNLMPAPLNMRSAQDGALNFGALTSVGAEIYTGGTVSKKSGMVNLDMAVYDAVSGKQLLRKLYTGQESQLRPIGQQFCADLVELLTGKRSVFGSKIVFVSNRTGSKEIYMCDFDGQSVVQLTSSKSISLSPALSSDGRYLAWTDYASGWPDLHIKNLSTQTSVSVSKQGVCIAPRWRNGTDECAVTLSFEGDQEIYLVKPNGQISRRLTYSRGIDVSPTFSPDGSRMAFVSQRSGGPQIFIQEMQSKSASRLTFSGTYNTQPAWSPAGNKIAYSSWQKNGEINIFVVNADGSGLLQLTSGANNNESPSWSPDGSMIVFSSSRLGKKRLFVMNADGTNQRALMQSDGDQQQPFWSNIR